MARGRKPKPTALKLLAGNPGKRPLPTDEPVAPSGIPEPPEWLCSEARKEWFYIVPELEKMGILSTIDHAALAVYCEEYATYAVASTKLRRSPRVIKINGALGPHPWLSVRNKAAENMRKFLVEFGLSPSSRSRVKAPPKAEDGSAFGKLMGEAG